VSRPETDRPHPSVAAAGPAPRWRSATRRGVAIPLLAGALALTACAALAPLQRPPIRPGDELDQVTTREEAIRVFGPPAEIRASDVGQVLIYRRAVIVDANPNRYYGEDYGNRLSRFERVLLYVDGDGRIVRRGVELE
jgi:hypothetical protein